MFCDLLLYIYVPSSLQAGITVTTHIYYLTSRDRRCFWIIMCLLSGKVTTSRHFKKWQLNQFFFALKYRYYNYILFGAFILYFIVPFLVLNLILYLCSLSHTICLYVNSQTQKKSVLFFCFHQICSWQVFSVTIKTVGNSFIHRKRNFFKFAIIMMVEILPQHEY